ncbi:hypothetical protein AAC387_Pa05g3822 [Persea americana]
MLSFSISSIETKSRKRCHLFFDLFVPRLRSDKSVHLSTKFYPFAWFSDGSINCLTAGKRQFSMLTCKYHEGGVGNFDAGLGTFLQFSFGREITS